MAVLVVASVRAQHLAWPYGATIVPAGAVAPVVTVKEPSTVVVKSVVDNPVQMKGLFGVPVSSIYQYPHVFQVAIPSQDTTRGMPQPMEDTPEVLFILYVETKAKIKVALPGRSRAPWISTSKLHEGES
jgi:hypothetical protein